MLKNLTLILICNIFIHQSFAQNYPEMVKVEGGTFILGGEPGVFESYVDPFHAVTLKTFSIAKTETTVLQWRTYCKETGSKMPDPPSWELTDNQPIAGVSWDDAVAYCKWMSNKMGKLYRLPTEAEWEYAARGGKAAKGFKYSGGSSIDLIGWYKENSGKGAKSVAQKKANELGIYDMSGNVWEWCHDWYADYTEASQNNPIGPASGSYRVLRGGAWGSTENFCWVAYRFFNTQDVHHTNIGFRVVAQD